MSDVTGQEYETLSVGPGPVDAVPVVAMDEGETWFRLTLDHLPDAIVVYDPQGRYRFINARAREALGRSLDEVWNKTDDELFVGEEAPWYLPVLHRVLAQQLVQTDERLLEGPTGPRIKTARFSPVFDAAGQLRQVLGILRDTLPSARGADAQERLFQQSLNLICICGFDGYIKRWNPAWNNVLGFSSEEMMSRPLRDLLHTDDRGSLIDAAQRLRQGRGTRPIESRIRCKNGSFRWILWNAVPSVEEQVYIATGQDITARKQVEEQLRESQERFQLIASATKEAVWDWDLRENRTWRNDGFVRTFGMPDEEVESPVSWWRDRIHPDDRPRILANMPPALVDGRQQWVLEYRLRRIDGSYAHVYDRGFVVFDSEGQPVRMVGSIMDISALKNTEEKLRESEERFQTAARATRDAIWDWDLRKGHVWRSEGFQTLFGYRADEVEPDLAWWSDRIHPLDRDRILKEISQASPGSTQSSSFEYRFRRADGTYADVYDRGFMMLSPDGQPARMIGSIMDVSERRRAEEVAHMQRAELAHIARLSTMGEIATGLAHELNQPLTAISNYAESCTQAITTRLAGRDEKLLGWIDKITTNTHRAAEMIRRLRGFTRKGEGRRSTADINEVIDEVIELLEAETRLQHVRIRWAPGPPAYAAIDRMQIQQVLVNLLHNAYDAMAANPDDQRLVTISAVTDGSKVRISVSDQGPGIPAEHRDRIFEAFFTSKPKGVGIGLAISRSIVEAHRGRFWVTDNPDRGVTFHLTLPLSPQ